MASHPLTFVRLSYDMDIVNKFLISYQRKTP